MTSKWRITQGDCRVEMKALEPDSIDSIVTDPPYELGFMGKGWDRSGIAYDVIVWGECLRVLKPGGHLLAFGGSRTYHRLACAVEDAGFEIRDQIQWIYGSGFPKSLDVSKAIDAAAKVEGSWTQEDHPGRSGTRIQALDGTFGDHQFVHSRPNNPDGRRHVYTPASNLAKQWNGWGTALKPAHEPIVLARKPLIGTIAENVLQHGTGGLNVDGCRVESESRDLIVSNRRNGNNTYGDGLCGTLNAGATELGRWPANVIHDGSKEVIAAFPDAPGQQGDLNGHSKERLSKGIFGDMKSARDAVARFDSGSAARFFYCAKATQDDRNEGLEDLAPRVTDEVHKRPRTELNDPRRHGVMPRQNFHPTVKPTDLMRYLCRLVTPPGGLVLDPFCGSGSTGKAAMLEGLRFIGIELSEEYCELSRRRIEAATKQGLLFG